MKFLLFLLISATVVFGQSRTFNYSANAPRSKEYSLTVDSKDCLVYPSKAADVAIFELSGSAKLCVKYFKKIDTAAIRPLSKNIPFKIVGDCELEFELSNPCNLSLEINGRERPLFVFANPPAKVPSKKKRQIIFKEGNIYEVGQKSKIDSDTAVIVEGGAIVYGTFMAGDRETTAPTSNISVSGYGIISGEKIPNSFETKIPASRLLDFNKTNGVEVSGVVLMQSPNWTLTFFACQNIKIDNIKTVSEGACDDGIDIVSCKNVLVENCFLRNKDDCIAIKAGIDYGGIKFFDHLMPNNSENITVKNCVLWNSIWGNALEIGFETRADEIKNIVFANIDILRTLGTWGNEGVFTIHNGDRAKVSNVLYKDIRVEEAQGWLVNIRVLNSKYSKDKKRGSIDNIRFENITAKSSLPLKFIVEGYDENSRVTNVAFKNVLVDEKPLSTKDFVEPKFADKVIVE